MIELKLSILNVLLICKIVRKKNNLLSEKTVQDVMSKLDRGEIISEQEFETLKRANGLMRQDMLKDRDTVQHNILYENFSLSVQKEINHNNTRIERHEKKMTDYVWDLAFKDFVARLSPLKHSVESSITSSNSNPYSSNNESNSGNDSNNSPDSNNNESNSGNDSNNNPGSSKPFDPPRPNEGGDNDFDDFTPSFDFDDF